MKVTKYSVRRLLDEMLSVSLVVEVGFLGKELVGVFGYRSGKQSNMIPPPHSLKQYYVAHFMV
jgi:hypothetical protein